MDKMKFENSIEHYVFSNSKNVVQNTLNHAIKQLHNNGSIQVLNQKTTFDTLAGCMFAVLAAHAGMVHEVNQSKRECDFDALSRLFEHTMSKIMEGGVTFKPSDTVGFEA